MKRIAIINSHSAFGENSGKDALDLALILGSYEQSVSVFFHDDGVFQLQASQHPELVEQKHYTKSFAAFDLYDIEHVYVCHQSLLARNLSSEFSIENVNVLAQDDFNEVLKAHDVILRF